jgi:DNA helicase-2/ATP-dependent DNA helicase PcrA
LADGVWAEEKQEGRAVESQVTLMSLHGAKGLEFMAVFMVGMEEGLLPHSRAIYDPKELEEERRLCYVGITRAKEQLHFSFARQRWQYGVVSAAVKSRFLADIDDKLLNWRVVEEERSGGGSRGGRAGSNGYSNGASGRRGWFEGGSGWWGDDEEAGKRRRRRRAVGEKNLDDGRKIVIDENMIDDLLRDDLDVSEFLRS